jgi:hypothetical protein
MNLNRAFIASTATIVSFTCFAFAAQAATKPSAKTKPGKATVSGKASKSTTRLGWSKAVKVASPALTDLRLSVDAEGSAVAVWSAGDAPGRQSIFASRQTREGTWTSPIDIDGMPTDSSFEPQMGMDPGSGRVMAIWLTEKGLWGRISETGGGWGKGNQIDTRPTTQGGLLRNHRVGVDGSGNAIAVWEKNDELGQFSIWSSRFSAGGWSTPASIEKNDLFGMLDTVPVLAVSPGGEAIAVWHSSASETNASTPRRGLWTNRYSVATGWGQAVELVQQEPNSLISDGHDLAMDAKGNALFVWSQINTPSPGERKTGIYSKRFTAGAWQTVKNEVATPSSIVQSIIAYPRLSMSPTGHAMVAWSIDDDNSLLVSIAPPNAAWGATTLVKATSKTIGIASREKGKFVPTIDGSGNGFAQWNQTAPNEDPRIWIRRFEPGKGWDTAAIHQSDASSGIGHTALATNDRGDAVSIFYQNGGLWARSFSSRR